jgi:hypothetical protein
MTLTFPLKFILNSNFFKCCPSGYALALDFLYIIPMYYLYCMMPIFSFNYYYTPKLYTSSSILQNIMFKQILLLNEIVICFDANALGRALMHIGYYLYCPNPTLAMPIPQSLPLLSWKMAIRLYLFYSFFCPKQCCEAGAARSRIFWSEPEP